MLVIDDIPALRGVVRGYHSSGESIGIVPTMGYLHEGHLSLVDLARKYSQRVLVSIFVNPAQFNDPEDLKKYPQDLERDSEMLRSRGADALFLPSPEIMYPTGFQSWVNIEELTSDFEGAFRPGHFKGVTTVVAMLFNLLQPDIAVFGEKDFQQLRVIEQMVDDLKFDLKIVRGPLVRESDGLAMSSRNVRLSPEARAESLALSQGLFKAKQAFDEGERSSSKLVSIVNDHLNGMPGIKIDYVKLVEERRLKEIPTVSENSRLLVAAFVGGVRLLDNLAFYP
jgi:pantoate--beta-alanine ligase